MTPSNARRGKLPRVSLRRSVLFFVVDVSDHVLLVWADPNYSGKSFTIWQDVIGSGVCRTSCPC